MPNHLVFIRATISSNLYCPASLANASAMAAFSPRIWSMIAPIRSTSRSMTACFRSARRSSGSSAREWINGSWWSPNLFGPLYGHGVKTPPDFRFMLILDLRFKISGLKICNPWPRPVFCDLSPPTSYSKSLPLLERFMDESHQGGLQSTIKKSLLTSHVLPSNIDDWQISFLW